MSRWNDQLDDPWTEDGDRFFIGYNEKLNRINLPEGIVAKSRNKRFTDGTARPRSGTIMPAGNFYWYRSDNSIKFIGSAVYRNPNGAERLILVPSSPIYGTQGISSYDVENNNYLTIGLPPGMTFQPNWEIQFAQGFDKLIVLITGWTNEPPTSGHHVTNGMFWDGNESTRVLQPFELSPDPELQIIPPSRWAWPVSNRIAYVGNFLPPQADPPFSMSGPVYDHVLLSDILDYANMDPIGGDFKINAGEGDHVHTILPYAYDTLIIFMHRSIHMLSNFSLDFSLAILEVLTSYMGCGSIRSPIQVGQEVYFMVERLGVFRLTEILERRLMARPLPISDDIQPVIDRINWPYQNKIVSAAEDNYLFFAVPLDQSTVANVILVLNTTTSKWETIDEFDIPNFAIDNILSVHFGGVRRLVAVQNGPPALIYLLYEGTQDQTLFDVHSPRYTHIDDMIETRGYGLKPDSGIAGFRNFRRGSIVIETVNPNVKVTGVAEGVNEEKVLRQSITKDHRKSYIHGVPDLTDGYSPPSPAYNPKFEDYSGLNPPDQFDAQDFSMMPDGEISSLIIPAIPPPIRVSSIPAQTSRERFPVRMIDQWLSLRIENTQGQCAIKEVSVESIEAKRAAGVAA